MISRRTWLLGALGLLSVLWCVYAGWRDNCSILNPHKVHAAVQDASPEAGFEPCQIWREMPLTDKLAALVVVTCIPGFFFSLTLDLMAERRRQKANADFD